MAQINFTLDSELIKGLFMSDCKNDSMKKLMESILNQMLEAQVTEVVGAEPYERSDERTCYRNGNRPRTMKTRIGTLELSVPRVRNGEFSPELFERYQRNEQALVLAMMEMVIQGVSTRKVTKITEELCGTSFSKSTISKLCENLDPIVYEFRNRPLNEEYPFIICDAIYVKVRENGRVRSKAVLIAIGVNEGGIREVIGFDTAESEAETNWNDFFKSLKDRGLNSVDIIVSDAHKGLTKAIIRQFQGSTWQRCQTHFSRNVLDVCPPRLQPMLKERLRSLYDAPTVDMARIILHDIIDDYEDTAPKIINVLEDGFDDITAVLSLPIKYRKRLRTSNCIERMNQEIRRRERVIRIFPNEKSLNRLMGAILIDLNDNWSSGRKWLNMQEYLTWRTEEKKKGEKEDAFEEHLSA